MILTVYSSEPIPHVADVVNNSATISAVITYGHSLPNSTKPCLVHLAEKSPIKATDGLLTTYRYGEVKSSGFVLPSHPDFNPSSASVAHTRCLSFLKTILGGPIFDLEAIWEEHTFFEFGDRSVAKTMGTMVQEPYVNHVPTV